MSNLQDGPSSDALLLEVEKYTAKRSFDFFYGSQCSTEEVLPCLVNKYEYGGLEAHIPSSIQGIYVVPLQNIYSCE